MTVEENLIKNHITFWIKEWSAIIAEQLIFLGWSRCFPWYTNHWRKRGLFVGLICVFHWVASSRLLYLNWIESCHLEANRKLLHRILCASSDETIVRCLGILNKCRSSHRNPNLLRDFHCPLFIFGCRSGVWIKMGRWIQYGLPLGWIQAHVVFPILKFVVSPIQIKDKDLIKRIFRYFLALID